MDDLRRFSSIIKAITIGLLLGGAFLHHSLWWLALVGGVAFCVFVTTLPSRTAAFWYGWLIGLVKILIVISWGWYIFPVDWMSFASLGVQLLLLCSFWCLSAASLGIGYAIVGIVLWKLWYCARPWIQVCVIPLFLLADMLGAAVFSLVMSGPGSSLNIQYANGWVGFALAEHGLLLTAAQYGGVYILSLIFGGLVAAFWFWFEDLRYIWCGVGVFTLVLTSFMSGMSYQSNGERTVAVVHTDFARKSIVTESMRQGRHTNYREIMEALLEKPADYVLLPEDARFVARLDIPGDFLSYLRKNGNDGALWLDTARRDRGATTLRAYMYDTNADLSYQFDKGYLVPQGEYVPYVYRLVASLFGANSQLMGVLRDMNYGPGIAQTSINLPPYAPAVLFCFESIDPLGVRRQIVARGEVPFVAHVISHAWFERSPKILWRQLDTMLRVQAVWNDVPIIQAANQAPNKVYLPDGTSRELPADSSGDRWWVSYIEV